MTATGLLTACCLLMATVGGKTTVSLELAVSDGFRPTLAVGAAEYRIDLSDGKGRVEVALSGPSYAVLSVGKYDRVPLFLEPGKPLNVRWTAGERKGAAFEGDGAPENAFLQQGRFYTGLPVSATMGLTPRQAAQAWDEAIAANQAKLDSTDLPPAFRRLERERIRINGYAILSRHSGRDTAEMIRVICERLIEDPALLVIPEYGEYLQKALLRLIPLGGEPLREGRERVRQQMAAMLRHVADPQLRGFLADACIFPCITHNGPAGAEDLVAQYHTYVTDPVRRAQFDRALVKFDNISKGMPCPGFTLDDVAGRRVSLDDLRGKYVYIDLWATWCGPCKAEIPYVAELEERYAGMDIHFVSISIDRNKDIGLWKEMVAEKNMGGIQLHLGEDWDWLRNFMPASMAVPRFLLLDPQGRILDAAMSRPSDPATRIALDVLLGKQ